MRKHQDKLLHVIIPILIIGSVFALVSNSIVFRAYIIQQQSVADMNNIVPKMTIDEALENDLIYPNINIFTVPFKTALATFVSFNLIGIIPLLVYVIAIFTVLDESILFPVSCIGTGLALLIVGYMRGSVTQTNKAKSMFQTTMLGGLAAFLAYFVGEVLAKYFL